MMGDSANFRWPDTYSLPRYSEIRYKYVKYSLKVPKHLLTIELESV